MSLRVARMLGVETEASRLRSGSSSTSSSEAESDAGAEERYRRLAGGSSSLLDTVGRPFLLSHFRLVRLLQSSWLWSQVCLCAGLSEPAPHRQALPADRVHQAVPREDRPRRLCEVPARQILHGLYGVESQRHRQAAQRCGSQSVQKGLGGAHNCPPELL